MGLTIRSKFMSEEILKKRRQIIEKEKFDRNFKNI